MRQAPLLLLLLQSSLRPARSALWLQPVSQPPPQQLLLQLPLLTPTL